MARPPSATDQRIDALYVKSPGEFTSARNALARELTSARDPRAADVKAMARPTLPVWAINLAARGAAREIEELLEATEQVMKAHRLLLGGGSRDALLAANRRLGAALEEAVASAASLAESEGHPLSTSVAGRVRTTLRSLAFGQPEARQRLRAGRVTAEATGTGLDTLETLAPIRPRPGPAAAKERRRDERADEERARALASARETAESAEQDVGEAMAAAARARGEMDEAQRRAAEARGRLQDAEGRIEQARRRLEEARRSMHDLERGA